MTESVLPGEPLAKLRVIDRLQVGPPEIEPRRVIVPYTIHGAGQSDTFEFIYRFEESVFDPASEESRNLAAMMGAQVALNYGLFCNEIVFSGPFDRTDQRFLTQMAANTAREIYVKKLLEPNPFLNEEARDVPIVRRDSYLLARLEFPDPVRTIGGDRSPTAAISRQSIAVLSSGGKESLLADSLLREIGCDVHAIFINESGQHWSTAINAYRHFQAHVSGTVRVWTNSDRLFSWMLRHLPFIRADFSRIRADEYPIRLWTVAVFLFGALPLLRKRGIARLVIGDEFDTTDRRTHEGITHYNGLYDQSRYFDHTLSRYFQRKGWGVSQFSILRPLSELLIEKVLVERYPDLQQLQTSCHSSHVEGDRARPCGQCEKCSRVVAMLLALGGDPTRCGYTTEQVSRSLEQWRRQGAMQEGPALVQIAWMLRNRGLLPEGETACVRARERCEVLKLRFDPERSPMDDLPVDLRAPLYRILLQHAEGAVHRTGRRWIDVDPLTHPGLMHPYRFESSHSERTMPSTLEARPDERYLWGELTWPEAEARLKDTDVALLPVGAIEQHGPHLPLDTDAFDAERLSHEVAEQCRIPRPLVLPLIPYGVSYHHDDFAGTISIGPEVLARLVYEIGMAVARNGITKLVIVNGHGGNGPTLHFAAQQINRDAHIFTCVDSGETSDADIETLADTPGDVHAGEIETSTSLANRPHLVQLDKAASFVPQFSSHYLDFSSKRSVDWYARTRKISKTGVLGDPTRASVEKGKRMWQLMIDHLVGLVEDLKSMTLDEIHQKTRF